MLRNKGARRVAYRVKCLTSVDMFDIKEADGCVEPGTTSYVYVSLGASRKMDLRALADAKFQVDVIEADDRYAALGPMLFWARYGPEGLHKEIGADFTLLPSLASALSSPLSPSSPMYSPQKSRVRWSDDAAVSPLFSTSESGKRDSSSLGTPVMILPDQSVPSSQPLKDYRLATASLPENSMVYNAIPIVIQQKFSKPKGRLLDLMVKNVSRDNLLTPDEIEVSL